MHSKLSTDGRPPLVHGFNQGISFYEAETFLNPTNTEGGVNEKWNILISFVSRFFKVVHSRRLQSIFFFKNTWVPCNNRSHYGLPVQLLSLKHWFKAFEMNILHTSLSSTSLFFFFICNTQFVGKKSELFSQFIPRHRKRKLHAYDSPSL